METGTINHRFYTSMIEMKFSVVKFFHMQTYGLSEPLFESCSTIWEYMQLKQSVTTADVIIALGSNDLRVAEYAAQLMKKNIASVLVCSGGVAHQDDLLATDWAETEAEKFSSIAQKAGVEKDKILLEKEATNTAENIQNSIKLLESEGLACKKLLLVQKPYMERRTIATADMVLDKSSHSYFVTSPSKPFGDYYSSDLEAKTNINIMLGDLHRIARYPSKGFMSVQEIPNEVVTAFNLLVSEGFDKHLLNDSRTLFDAS